MTFYLVGIKGSAMASLARILIDYGHVVLGVDEEEDYYTNDSLKDIKIDKFYEMNLRKDYYYIIGNAFVNHKVTKYIINSNYNYDYYPHFIDTFFSKFKIAISGSHGKTTTTKIITTLLDNPTYLIGDGSGYGNPKSNYFVFEACEYKNTFLNYHPQIAVINNIDFDHPDFFESRQDTFKSFQEFADQSEIVIFNGDDPLCQKLSVCNKISFGFLKENDLYCEYETMSEGYILKLHYNNIIEEIFLPLLGRHNIYNFLAAFAVSHILNIKTETIRENALSIKLPKRRLETIVKNEQIFICDYAHHPTEIEALHELVSLKYKEYDKVIVFEPHTFSRTMKLKDSFKKALSLYDKVYVTEIFASAREKESFKDKYEVLQYLNYEFYEIDSLKEYINTNKFVILFVGAGIIDKKMLDFINEYE